MYLSRSRNVEASRVLLFIPYAGGTGESFIPWFKHFSRDVDCRYLQLPARGGRMNEAMPESIDRLTDCILDEMYDISDKQISFFGHSMGGLIAYDLAQKMEKIWDKSAQTLFISSCRAPSQSLKYHLSELDDEEFITKLSELGGSDILHLFEQPELRELFLPALRCDVALCEEYILADAPALQSPLRIIWGTEDYLVTDEMINEWSKFSHIGDVRFYPYAGDHFYYQRDIESVSSIIREAIGVDL